MRSVFAVVLLLAVPLVHAASDPNPSSRTVAATTLDVDIAGLGVGIAGVQDIGNSVTNPDQTTYYIWDADGSLRASRGIDPTNCSTGGDCTTSARAVALSGDGNKFAVAGWPNGNGDSRIVFGTFLQGATSSADLATPSVSTGQAVLDLDMDDTGSVVLVGSRVIPVVPATPPATEPGRVTLFRWAGTTPVQAWVNDTASPATVVSVSGDGLRAAVAAGRPVRFDLAGSSGTAYVNTAVPGNALDVGMATGTPRWSVVGTDQGYFAVFNAAGGDSNPSFQAYQASRSASPVRAVAIQNSGSAFAVGNDNGDLWLFNLSTTSATPVSLLASASSGAISDLAFSKNGAYLAVAHATGISLYDVSANSLNQLWNATLANSIGKVAIDNTGDHVMAASGSQVVVYSAIHRVVRSGPTTAQNLAPGTQMVLTYSFENTGNRAETLALSAQKETGWNATLSAASMLLAPGENRTVTMNVKAPDRTPPGDHFVQLTHNLASGGGDVILPIPIKIVAQERWILNATEGQIRPIDSGAQASYAFTVLNEGNVVVAPPIKASVDLAGWTATINGTLVPIQPGELLPFNVVVTAPASAIQLQTAVISVSAGGLNVLLTATVGAHYAVALTPISDVTVEVGKSTKFPVIVRNTGNAPDGLTLASGPLPFGWTLSFGGTGGSVKRFDLMGPATSETVQATLTVSASATPDTPVQITFTVTSDGDAAQVASAPFLVTPKAAEVSETSSTTDGDNGIPAPGLILALAALAVAFATKRRR